ncbi:substrate-binding domain-containing protein [Paracoccus laeviglucosivorans]|uniref:Transcriptional regulator, LacI family n=1 Tax=Paracoccus laeviglucosivorans TaxID=1197861 RepID=A0A521ESM5_9RHOB|nr:substrate-binding domain-containing protein [Paracoccus laeviglucosivorans]SMO86946.1 transcriptional regulator, LacI family [Paracoccus laeviglucosivorans]
MTRRPTITDLAKASGTSVATVDRVINGRLPVREPTARRILEAAREIGFHGIGTIENRLRANLPERRIGLLLQDTSDQFYAALEAALRSTLEGSRSFRASVRTHCWTGHDPGRIAAELDRMAARYDAIAFVSPNHPLVEDAVARLRQAGKLAFALLSDCAPMQRSGYIGIDSRKAGRAAAWMIHRCALRPGKVVVIVGDPGYRGHELAEMAFRGWFRENAPAFNLLETRINGEDDARTRALMAELLEAEGQLAGVYMTGGGKAGAIEALAALPQDQRPTLILPSLTQDTRLGLARGIVTMTICEPLGQIADVLERQIALEAEGRGDEIAPVNMMPIELRIPEIV